jgi:lysyl-tRNA synthetase, class II
VNDATDPGEQEALRRDAMAAELHARGAGLDAAVLEAQPHAVHIAGRMMTRRVMGKAAFAHVQDGSGAIQVYVQRDALGAEAYGAFNELDLGDVLGVAGTLMRTRTGELTVRASDVRLLAKALHPLPEKWHGLQDPERRHRQRYLDLMVNEDSRRVFTLRSRLTAALRRHLDAAGYLEVETPMMQPLPGGATARPFVTHHNALDTDLYLRVAPELYLKRLVVGGFERVYELGKCFRNEGVSTRHNPEFTILEFYAAYLGHTELMDFIEHLLRTVAQELLGTTTLRVGDAEVDVGPRFARVSLHDAVARHYGLAAHEARAPEPLAALCRRAGLDPARYAGAGELAFALFEHEIERTLIQPTFVTGHPVSVSPLARRSADDPELAERFELYVGGRELANGFSELNDPEDQAARLRAQAARKAAGDLEAMYYDADYIRALEYGLPPTAGAGIGVDRLTMLLADAPSIRDVVLFPHLRPEG